MVTDEQFEELQKAVIELQKWMCEEHCRFNQHQRQCEFTRVYLPKEDD